MIRSSQIALLVAGLAAFAFSANANLRAAASASPAAQTTTVSTMPAPHATRVKFRGTVVNQTSTFITVQSSNPDHQNELRTFSFSPQLKPKMQAILDAGGYQRGDRVVVTALAGSTIALNVRGRHSKPA